MTRIRDAGVVFTALPTLPDPPPAGTMLIFTLDDNRVYLMLPDGTYSTIGSIGDMDFGGFALVNYTVLEVAEAIDGAYEIDLESGTVFILTVTGNVTVTFTNPPASPRVASATVILIQGGAGSYTVTFTGAMWDGGTAPNLATAAGTEANLTFIVRDGGSEIRGYMAAEDMS